MIDRPRPGLSFVRMRAMADDDGESKGMPFSLLLATPYIAVLLYVIPGVGSKQSRI